jgi:hypothetical protein
MSERVDLTTTTEIAARWLLLLFSDRRPPPIATGDGRWPEIAEATKRPTGCTV